MTFEIFNSHTMKYLKSEISKTNIKNYSKMNKGSLIELMLINIDRFEHIKHKKSDTHKMSDGTVMSGKSHNDKSVIVEEALPITKKIKLEKSDKPVKRKIKLAKKANE